MAVEFCPDALYTGACNTPDCPLKHDVKFCSLCAIVCSPAAVYDAHVNGRQHRSSLAATSPYGLVRCSICEVPVSGDTNWFQHLQGIRHQNAAARKHISPSTLPLDASVPNSYRCFTCKRAVHINDWRPHLRSGVHHRLQQAAIQRSKLENAEQDRNGVTVSHAEKGVDFGVVSRTDASGGVQVDVVVATTISSSSISVVRVEALTANRKSDIPFSAHILGKSRSLATGKPISIRTTFQSGQRGRFTGRLVITLQDGAQRPFLVVRELRAVVGNASHYELLKAVAPFVHRRPATWRHNTPVVEGRRPPALDAVQWTTVLDPSHIPQDLTNILKHKNEPTRRLTTTIKARYLQRGLSYDTHTSYFRTLLWIEEDRLQEDLRMYDLADVRLVREGKLYTLSVPGLAEKRPSVVIGDTIRAQSVNGRGHTHKGYVHEVRLDDIRVHFNSSFQVSERYNIRFEYNRTPIKRQHQTLMFLSTSSQRLLFPLSPQDTPLDRVIRPHEMRLDLFDARIASNAAQLQAIKSTLHMKEGAAPLVIVGPPGTGKTVVVVENILQILHHQPGARILACAPSNSAADIIAQRLSALPPGQLFRCNAIFRDKTTLPADLLPYSTFRANHFALPPVAELIKFKVIVSTCGNASFAHNIGMHMGHFTHIFIDEAGQGTEPEVLTAAIKTLTTMATRVIIAGDPKQLGPVIRSSLARELGLGKSYLERLMELPLYQDASTGRGRSYIKLLKNFRSHRSILEYPNEKFYDGELEVCGPLASINSFLDWSQLPNRKFPVIFHAISGENERESFSPSYFNIDEATEVVEYIKELLRDRRYPIRGDDIGVITPYYAQTRKIRKLLQTMNINGVKVASVEEFQGDERRVVIISTVRSSRDLLSYDAKFTLGFVSNPRRFNVAVTRAKALLIVVGDAYVLSIDPMWRGFMNYVYLHGGWRGDVPTWDPNEPVRTEGDYSAEIREAAAAEMDALMARLAEGEDLEGEANVDQAFLVPE